MPYYFPQPYKCSKCGHEFDYGQDDPWHTPVLREEEQTDRGIVTHSMPVCPKCWEKFLRDNLGLGYCTQDWGFGGSHYDKKVKNVSE